MKRFFMVMLAVLALLGASCGGEVAISINIPAVHPPSISLIGFSPNSALIGQGEGIVMSTVTIDFFAPDADVSILNISVVDSRGFPVSRAVTSLVGYSGVVRGTVAFSIDFSTSIVESYTFSAFITDTLGNASNPVFGTFHVIP